MTISRRLESLRHSIIEACSRVDRDPASVQLVAVTKYASLDSVRELIALGHRDFGESRPQQLAERAVLLDDATLSWHLIGSLQRNKIRKVLPYASVIHSIDSLRLLDTLDRLATELELRPRLLLEVNVSGEVSKQGFSVEELKKLWPGILDLRSIDVQGLMTMAPYSDDPEQSRPIFRSLREFRDTLAAITSHPLPELSMGMSGDYRVAIEEGATIIRIGSALFEE